MPWQPDRPSRALAAWARPAMAVLFALGASAPAIADICKYVDGDGGIIYSNTDVPNARRIECILSERRVADPAPAAREPSAPAPAQPSASRIAPRVATPTPANFPRVDSSTQRSRDDLRLRVLREELATEEKALAEARSLYNNGAPAALPEERSHPEKLAERVNRLRQTVQQHERNVQALRKEISGIR